MTLRLMAILFAALIISAQRPVAAAMPDGAVEVKEKRMTPSNDAELPWLFAPSKPFLINISDLMPDSRAFGEYLARRLSEKKLVERVAFMWFSSTKMEPVQVSFGEKIPVEVAQLIVKACAEKLKPGSFVFSMTAIQSTEPTYLEHIKQQVYIGGVHKPNGKEPASAELVKALSIEGLTQKEFIELLMKH